MLTDNDFMASFEEALELGSQTPLPDEGLRYVHHWLAAQTHRFQPPLPTQRLWNFLRAILEKELSLKQSENYRIQDIPLAASSPSNNNISLVEHSSDSSPNFQQPTATAPPHYPRQPEPTRGVSPLSSSSPTAKYSAFRSEDSDSNPKLYSIPPYNDHATSHNAPPTQEYPGSTQPRSWEENPQNNPPIVHKKHHLPPELTQTSSSSKARYVSTSSSYKIPPRRPVTGSSASRESIPSARKVESSSHLSSTYKAPRPPSSPSSTNNTASSSPSSSYNTASSSSSINPQQPATQPYIQTTRLPKKRITTKSGRPSHFIQTSPELAESLSSEMLASFASSPSLEALPKHHQAPPPDSQSSDTTHSMSSLDARLSQEALDIPPLPRPFENAIRDMLALLKRSPIVESLNELSFEIYLKRRLPEYVQQDQINMIPIWQMMLRIPSVDEKDLEDYFLSVIRCGLPWQPLLPTHLDQLLLRSPKQSKLPTKKSPPTKSNSTLTPSPLDEDLSASMELSILEDHKLLAKPTPLEEVQIEKSVHLILEALSPFELFYQVDSRRYSYYLRNKFPQLIRNGALDLNPLRRYLLHVPQVEKTEVERYLTQLSRLPLPWPVKLH